MNHSCGGIRLSFPALLALAVLSACGGKSIGGNSPAEVGDASDGGGDSPAEVEDANDGGIADAPVEMGAASSTDADAGQTCSLQSSCNGQCLDTTSDPNHCGGCNPCPIRAMICAASTCLCNAGTHFCAAQGVCALDTDPTLCGASCAVCPGAGIPRAQFGTVSCVNGGCVLTCQFPSLTACSTGPTTADCFDLTASTSHCGSCSTACDATANGTPRCAGTPPACGVICDPGYTQCVSDAGPPSCAYAMNDPLNCGSCGHLCPGPDAGKGLCVNGVCQ